MGGTNVQLPIGRQVSLPGHFDLPVTLESARPLGKGFECRVRLHDGTLDEAVISEQEAAALAGSTPDPDSKTPLANADHLRLLVESARIRLAYARDRQFAVSLSGISGADLVIACVGAGLRAFTRFPRVEYANGEEVPAERFLTEVETVVLETVLARLSKEVGGKGTSLAGLDAATRFYILWRFTYNAAELAAGEAIIFANGTHVELDGQHSLTSGAHPLVSKKKGKYALSDFAERGENKDLGMPSDAGQPASLVDVLHRTLWLMEKRPTELPAFLRDSQVNREQLRLVAQALAGPALNGGELGDVSPTAELSALGKLTANWQGVVENAALTSGQREEKKVGQKQMF